MTLNSKINIFSLTAFVWIYLVVLNLFFHVENFNVVIHGAWVASLFYVVLLLLTIFGRLAYKTILLVFILATSLTLYFGYFYGVTLSEDIVFSAFETDMSLILELGSFKLFVWVFVTVVLPGAAVVRIKLRKTPPLLFLKKIFLSLFIGIFITALLGYIAGINLNSKGSIRDPQIPLSIQYFSPVDAIFFGIRGHKAYKEYIKSIQNVDDLSELEVFDTTSLSEDLNVVVIIGETARGDHWGLNGYLRDTTPKLSQISNVVNFINARSCDTITARSLPCIFTRMTKQEHSIKVTESSFVSIMRSLGFKTSIFSLQGYQSFYKYLGYDQLITKYEVIKEHNKAKAQDEMLLPYIDRVVNKSGKNLTILHTLGSHYSYKDRFNPNLAKYKPYCSKSDLTDCSIDEIVNAYDNTIVATDEFISRVIDKFKETKSIVFYVSDHGESLGGGGIYLHGSNPKIAPDAQFDIPFFIWMSEKYLASRSGSEYNQSLLSKSHNYQASHDNVFHSVLGCSGVLSKIISDNLNLCYSK